MESIKRYVATQYYEEGSAHDRILQDSGLWVTTFVKASDYDALKAEAAALRAALATLMEGT